MLNIKRIDGIPNATIYNLTDEAPFIERVRVRQLKLLGHILRLPDEELCKVYALHIPTHGKRKPGRQRTLFSRYIQLVPIKTLQTLHAKIRIINKSFVFQTNLDCTIKTRD